MSELPELPAGYHWQLCQGDYDRTGDIDADEADEIRIWAEPSDLALALTAKDGGWEVAEGYYVGRFVTSLDEAVELAT